MTPEQETEVRQILKTGLGTMTEDRLDQMVAALIGSNPVWTAHKLVTILGQFEQVNHAALEATSALAAALGQVKTLDEANAWLAGVRSEAQRSLDTDPCDSCGQPPADHVNMLCPSDDETQPESISTATAARLWNHLTDGERKHLIDELGEDCYTWLDGLMTSGCPEPGCDHDCSSEGL